MQLDIANLCLTHELPLPEPDAIFWQQRKRPRSIASAKDGQEFRVAEYRQEPDGPLPGKDSVLTSKCPMIIF